MFKPLQLSDSVTAISVQDPAIDWDRMVIDTKAADEKLRGLTDGEVRQQLMLGHGAESRDSLSTAIGKLLIKPGETLTRFTVGVIPSDEMVRISDDCAPMAGKARHTERAWRSFLASVRDIDGMGDKPTRGRTVQGVEYIDIDWLKKTFVRGLRDVAIEIGMCAWLWNQLTEDEVKN